MTYFYCFITIVNSLLSIDTYISILYLSLARPSVKLVLNINKWLARMLAIRLT